MDRLHLMTVFVAVASLSKIDESFPPVMLVLRPDFPTAMMSAMKCTPSSMKTAQLRDIASEPHTRNKMQSYKRLDMASIWTAAHFIAK